MAQAKHTATVDGAELTGLTTGVRYTAENSGYNTVYLVQAANKPATFDPEDAFILLPRPYTPSPSRKLHIGQSRVIKNDAGQKTFAYTDRATSAVVTVEAP